jgi:hypothetical protein
LPILRVPEFFRSQRQIILDTERLLDDQPRMTQEEFVRRSEGLGFDQRALRMRYGGLLGEEFESGRPAGDDGEAEEHLDEIRRLDEMEAAATGNEGVREVLEGLPQGLAHEHDSAEIATYFDSEIKAQLKAALEEMWGAEGRLRSLEPRQALPFEYRALTLLKIVQQRSRLYVQKVGFEAPALYPDEKRLTGDLGKILTVRRGGKATEDSSLAALRVALRALSEPQAVAVQDLLPAARESARLLAEQARSDPSLDLGALEDVERWVLELEQGGPVEEETSVKAAAVLWALLPDPARSPDLEAYGVTALGVAYRQRLAEEALP